VYGADVAHYCSAVFSSKPAFFELVRFFPFVSPSAVVIRPCLRLFSTIVRDPRRVRVKDVLLVAPAETAKECFAVVDRRLRRC
jgi:hypothetical protein